MRTLTVADVLRSCQQLTKVEITKGKVVYVFNPSDKYYIGSFGNEPVASYSMCNNTLEVTLQNG